MANLKMHTSFNLPVFVRERLKRMARDRYASFTAVLIEAVDRYLANRGLDQEALKQRPKKRIGTYTKSKMVLHDFLNNNNIHVEDELWKPVLSHYQIPVEVIESIADAAMYLGITKSSFLSLALLEMSLCESRQQKAA